MSTSRITHYPCEIAPDMKRACKSLAKLGGFTDTKRTGMASWSTILEGWDTLQAQVSGYRLAKEMFSARLDAVRSVQRQTQHT